MRIDFFINLSDFGTKVAIIFFISKRSLKIISFFSLQSNFNEVCILSWRTFCIAWKGIFLGYQYQYSCDFPISLWSTLSLSLLYCFRSASRLFLLAAIGNSFSSVLAWHSFFFLFMSFFQALKQLKSLV